MSEKPGRYQRSSGGLVGALIVTVACVLAFVGWRALFRGDAEVETQPVEWAESVKLADSTSFEVVRPRKLPDGWIATSVELRAGDSPRWGLGLLTDEEQFVGLRQERSPLAELLHTYVDKDAVAGKDATLASDVARTWGTWSDDGGDKGYSTKLGDDMLLVYGSAPAEDIEELIGLLTLP